MKKVFILVTVFLLFFAISATTVVQADYETEFVFQIGDPAYKVATFKFLGEEKTLSVTDLKEQLNAQGYGSYFASDEPKAGYTPGLDAAFRAYVQNYESKFEAAIKEMKQGG